MSATDKITEICFFLLVAYFIGSIPTGYWLAKLLKGVDIRQMGSGSTGATNVYRCIGKEAGILVFIIDFFKGYLPVVLAKFIVNQVHFVWGSEADSLLTNDVLPVLAATAALIGHSRSIFLNFQGGKSAATGLGTLFALNFKVGAATFTTWILILYLGKMVSLASILATASCIPFMALFGGPPAYIAYCTLGFIYVTYRHKANIKRMLSGTEPKIGKARVKE